MILWGGLIFLVLNNLVERFMILFTLLYYLFIMEIIVT